MGFIENFTLNFERIKEILPDIIRGKKMVNSLLDSSSNDKDN